MFKNRTTTMVFIIVVAVAAIGFVLFASQNKSSATDQQAGIDFLATEAKDPDVHSTPNGLEYKIETLGTGPRPGPTDTVTVNYRGTFIDGREFDSSYKRGEPTTFSLDQVIPGWTEGLQYMPVGSKFIFYVPPGLGYGGAGAGSTIPPNATLVFEIELLSVVPDTSNGG